MDFGICRLVMLSRKLRSRVKMKFGSRYLPISNAQLPAHNLTGQAKHLLKDKISREQKKKFTPPINPVSYE